MHKALLDMPYSCSPRNGSRSWLTINKGPTVSMQLYSEEKLGQQFHRILKFVIAHFLAKTVFDVYRNIALILIGWPKPQAEQEVC